VASNDGRGLRSAPLVCQSSAGGQWVTLIVAGSRDDFHLRDWQMVIASFIAVTGGGLAYAGAMAEVNADKEKEREELDGKILRSLGGFLR
jgi:hypothetical protein